MAQADLTVDQYNQIIKSTISEFLKFTDLHTRLDMETFSTSEIIMADIDYSKIEDIYINSSVRDIKDFVMESGTQYELYSDIRGNNGLFPTSVEIGLVANDIVEDNGNALMRKAITKVSENLDKVKIKVITPKIAARLGGVLNWLLTPVDAPSGGNPYELKEQYINRTIRSTVSAMLFYFINENKINVERINSNDMPKIDNTGVKNKYEDYY